MNLESKTLADFMTFLDTPAQVYPANVALIVAEDEPAVWVQCVEIMQEMEDPPDPPGPFPLPRLVNFGDQSILVRANDNFLFISPRKHAEKLYRAIRMTGETAWIVLPTPGP